MHREVLDSLVDAYLRPDGTLELYALLEAPKPKVTPPVYAPEVESKGVILLEPEEPVATEEPKNKSKKKK